MPTEDLLKPFEFDFDVNQLLSGQALELDAAEISASAELFGVIENNTAFTAALYDENGSLVGVKNGNAALLAAVNLAIEAALADGSMSQFVADANAAASGNTFEGLLTEAGEVPEG